MEGFTLRDAIEYWLSLGAEYTEMVSDDLQYSKKAILHHLLDTRALLIKNMLADGGDITEHTIQTINCFDVCEVDRVDCPTIPRSGCTWLKSTTPLPAFIKIASVTDVLANKRYDYVRWDKIRYKINSRTPSKAQYFTIKQHGDWHYMYIYGDSFIEKVSVSAIFQEPQEAAKIGCGGIIKEVDCNPLDTKLYLDASLRDQLFKTAWSNLIKINQTVSADHVNNDMVDTKGVLNP